MDYNVLKAAIAAYVKDRTGLDTIDGDGLQETLLAMVNSLGANYQFAGVAKLTPTQTDPGTPDQNVFYIAAEPGTYTNFPFPGGYLQVAENEVAIFKYNGQWSKETTGAATAAATAAQVNQLGQELYPIVKWAGGFVNYQTGDVIASASYNHTDYIPVFPGESIYCDTQISDNYAGIAFYDVEKNFLSGINSVIDNTITIPANAYYVRITDTAAHYQSMALTFSDRYENLLNRRDLEILNKKFQNLVWGSGYINYQNGNVAPSASWKCTDFIPVAPNATYNVNVSISGNAGIAFYDGNKKYISGVNSISGNTITIPEGAFYIRLSTNGLISEAYFYNADFLSGYAEKGEVNATKANSVIGTLTGYIYYASGLVQPSTTWYHSDFLPVIPNAEYVCTAQISGNAGLAYYDANKNYVSGINAFTNKRITIPDGVNYVRFSIPKAQGNAALYPVGNNNELFVTKAEYLSKNYTLKNNNKTQLNGLPDGANVYDASGSVVDKATYYGADNHVLSIPVSYRNPKNMVIRFRVKFNSDLNKRDGSIDYSATYPDLLNFFSMVSGSHKVKMGVLPDAVKNPDIKSDYSNYGQTIGIQGTTKVRAINANNEYQSPTDEAPELVYDNYNNKLLAGDWVFSVRWLDNTAEYADVCMSNDGTTLKFYHSTNNQVIAQYTLANYSTMTALYQALAQNEQLEIKFFQLVNLVPADLMQFDGIKLVSYRTVVDGPGYIGVTYPTKNVYDNPPVYIRRKINEMWHTVEIGGITTMNSGVFCCCFDGNYLYAGLTAERVGYFKDGFRLYFGGDENGAKINCSIKDIEIKLDNPEDTEFVSYTAANRVQLISNWHPKVFALEGHTYIEDVPDIVEGTTQTVHTYDRMECIFNKLAEKGYVPITITELEKYIKNGVAPYKRMFIPIYDDFQYEIYLNHRLNNLHKRFGIYACLAEITRQSTWEYDGVTYQVSDINDWMNREDWKPMTHTRHQDHNTLDYEELITGLQNDILDVRSYHIPQIGLVWPGGQANIMCLEAAKNYGWAYGFNIYRTGDRQAVSNSIKRSDNEMFLPRFVVSNSLGLNGILQNIM